MISSERVARTLAGRVYLVGAVSLGLAFWLSPRFTAAQTAAPIRPTLIVDATVLAVQTDAPACGDQAVAVWARIRVGAIRTPVGGYIPPELIVMVQCPGSVTVGNSYRFDLVSHRPTRGAWTMFSSHPSPTAPTATHWTLRARPLQSGSRAPRR